VDKEHPMQITTSYKRKNLENVVNKILIIIFVTDGLI